MNLLERVNKKEFFNHNDFSYHSIESATLFANELLNSHGLLDWTFKIVTSMKRNNIGYCNIYRKVIVMQARYFFCVDSAETENTIIHEIAHALTPGHGHDTVWKAKCKELGCEPKAKTNLRSKGGFVTNWVLEFKTQREQLMTRDDVVQYLSPSVSKSVSKKSETKRVAKPTKLAMDLYISKAGLSNFLKAMVNLGYKESYAMVQWKLCESR
ncbi:hypothetical protein BN80_265 [Yersinia phage phiR1-RT]|uniref:SprT-like domain-containing protein n=1 Tax=Yersinia phage phiR1-RT TaxID=1206558 RepID=I7KRH1_BPPR1|nr:hypothetical protein BN80_265 [Yersinia phage phiR1-RT]CCI88835.1 hypothetical protein BN80_265 [Yersinia phage phiR1-RT]